MCLFLCLFSPFLPSTELIKFSLLLFFPFANLKALNYISVVLLSIFKFLIYIQVHIF